MHAYVFVCVWVTIITNAKVAINLTVEEHERKGHGRSWRKEREGRSDIIINI